jgi:hypothetical protein
VLFLSLIRSFARLAPTSVEEALVAQVSASNLIVIIRTAGERTFRLCRELVGMQIRADAVEIVNETPFEAALRRTYEIGLQRGAKWTMTLDADVLVREGAIADLVAKAERLPAHFVQIEGLVHDKLTGLFRKAGHRIYRTHLLAKALEALPAPGSELRPEYATLQRMHEWGFPSREINLIIGIHDYEQYYGDIYRKAFVHANKHQVWLGNMVSRWKQGASQDADFRIALRGLCDGLMFSGVPSIDTRKHSESAAVAIRNLRMREKEQLAEDFAAMPYVDATLRRADETSVCLRGMKPILCKIRALHAQLGTFGTIPFLAGATLCRFGTLLKVLSIHSRAPHSPSLRMK